MSRIVKMAKKKICPWCWEKISNFLSICPKCKFIYKESSNIKEKIDISGLTLETQLEKIKEKKKKRDLNRSERLEKKLKDIKENMKDYKKKEKRRKPKKIKLLPWEYPRNNSANERYQQLVEEQEKSSKKVMQQLKEKWIDPNGLDVIPHSKLWPKWY